MSAHGVDRRQRRLAMNRTTRIRQKPKKKEDEHDGVEQHAGRGSYDNLHGGGHASIEKSISTFDPFCLLRFLSARRGCNSIALPRPIDSTSLFPIVFFCPIQVGNNNHESDLVPDRYGRRRRRSLAVLHQRPQEQRKGIS